MNTLVFDRRAELGEAPGTHALVVGVSRYQHLQPVRGKPGALHGLTVAARSAWTLQSWLVEHKDQLAIPLKSVRLLVAPSHEELGENGELARFACPCSADDLIVAASEWQRDACSSRDDGTIFYFAGNGFDLSPSDPFIAMTDYGSEYGPKLRGAIPVSNIVQGMAPSSWQPNIARTQLYLVDAGRRQLSDDISIGRLGAPSVFDVAPATLDDRSLAICNATSSGAAAYAPRGRTTYFLSALTECLQGRAAVQSHSIGFGSPQWEVTTDSLARILPIVMSERMANASVGSDGQRVQTSFSDAAVLVRLDSPPMVPVHVTFATPADLHAAQFEVLDHRLRPIELVGKKIEHESIAFELPAGLYQVRVALPNHEDAQAVVTSVAPPLARWSFDYPTAP